MLKKEEILRQLEGRTDDEKKKLLENMFGLSWDNTEGSCKSWYAKVFTYCNVDDLEEEINCFLFFVNVFGYLWGICFNEEKTVFLGCTCPCGTKQTILYYSITFSN